MYNEFSHYFLDVFLSPLKKKLIRYLIMGGLLKWKFFERNTSLNKNLNHFSEMFFLGHSHHHSYKKYQTLQKWRANPMVR